ncbi:MAG: SUF system NifU family Fe-S cluster assembly protein [Nitrospinae bacterium]|nr:SUF system NifU family Fe-S cluster assembly protein [Nitrospinota bacterium]
MTRYSEDLYQQVILDHNRKPKNFHELAEATHHCEGYNPLCGDRLSVYVRLNADGVIDEVSFTGSGCAISKASASMMTASVKGKTEDEARRMFGQFHGMTLGEAAPPGGWSLLGKLTIFDGVRKYPSRIKCATLAWHALVCALDRTGVVETV